MSGWVAGAVVGSAVIGAATSKSAAKTQASAITSAATTEAEAAEKAAERQAEAFRKAAVEQEKGIYAARSVETGAPQTVEDLYASVLKRDADPGGLAFYQQRFGSTIDPEEIAEFRANAASELARKTADPEGYAQDLARQGLQTRDFSPTSIKSIGETEALAAERAAAQLARANREAARIQAEQANKAFAEQQQLLGPFRDAGINALARIEAGLASGGEFAQPFTTERFQADPGYAFRLSEGQQALERQAAARGGLMSGAALKAATRFGQDMGSQEFQNAFNRYYAERQAQLDPLFDLYGGGMATSGDLASFAGARGANLANYLGAGTLGAGEATARGMERASAARTSSYLEDLRARSQAQRDLATTRASAYTGPAQFEAQGLLTAGQARAAGQRGAGESLAAGRLGVSNAITGALNTGINVYQQNQLLDRLYPTGGGSSVIPTNLPANYLYRGNFPATGTRA